MKIDRYNYEAFLLDLLEGSLSVEDQHELHHFLNQNPDCLVELSEIEPWVLEEDKTGFQNKQILKKKFPKISDRLDEHNFDLFSIARMEEDLSDTQLLEHESMVESDDFKSQQWIQWQNTCLVAEPVVFQGKEGLKKRDRQKMPALWTSVLSVAAALALLIVLFLSGPDFSEQELSVQKPAENEIQQSPDVSERAGPQVVNEEQASQQAEAVKQESNVMFSIKKDQERPPELKTKEATVIQENLQPRALRISSYPLNAAYRPGKPRKDQIKALDVPPVSIHLSSLSLGQIYEMDLQEVLVEYTREKDFSLWTIASAGIKGINKIAGSDISLLASRDQEGELTGFQLKSRHFSLTRPLGQEE
ncbi:MAG: hypothetical protein P1P86_01185 [Bacteroidales bacterium]|nr:hypothetical protein [Bacteroidales bacterium]